MRGQAQGAVSGRPKTNADTCSCKSDRAVPFETSLLRDPLNPLCFLPIRYLSMVPQRLTEPLCGDSTMRKDPEKSHESHGVAASIPLFPLVGSKNRSLWKYFASERGFRGVRRRPRRCIRRVRRLYRADSSLKRAVNRGALENRTGTTQRKRI